MFGIAILGALVAGFYGVLHDQVTYSISHEYFTKLKFNQFHAVNFGFPVRVFVSEVGFLATWWVGFFSGWFLARIAVPAWPPKLAIQKCLAAFLIVFLLAFAGGGVGCLLGLRHSDDYFNWIDLCWSLGVTDTRAFVQVAYIHNAGYIGGGAGLLVAIFFLHRVRKRE